MTLQRKLYSRQNDPRSLICDKNNSITNQNSNSTNLTRGTYVIKLDFVSSSYAIISEHIICRLYVIKFQPLVTLTNKY